MKKIKTLFCLMAIACTSLFAAFLTGCNSLDQLKCKHEWSAVKVIEPSTCTEKGKGEKTCKLCEKVETVKLDFEHVPTVIEAIKPTCTEKGRTDYVVCYACETVLVPYAELSPTGHKVVKDEAVAVTCLKDGLTEGEHCEVCEVVLLEQKKIVATGHNIVYYPEQAPTCTEAGYTAGEVCKNCGAYDSREEIPALGHTVVTVSGTPATCTESGLTDGKKCSACLEWIIKQTPIALLEHNYDEGSICINCGEAKPFLLCDVQVGDDLYGYKLVLAVSEEELLNAVAELSGICFYIIDDNSPKTSGGMFSINYYNGVFILDIYGVDCVIVNVAENSVLYNEVILNDEAGFGSHIVTIDEDKNEMSDEDRQRILSLFELVYVGE